MRNARFVTLVLIVPLLLTAAPARGEDRSVERFLGECAAATEKIAAGFAPNLAFDSWTVTVGDERGSSDRRPERVGIGQYPRVTYEKLEVGSLEAKSLLGQNRSGGLWSAWIGLSPKCVILEGSGSELTATGAKLTTDTAGNQRVLELAGHRIVFDLVVEEMAADPDDTADCFACEESDDCQSNDCAGPEGGMLCQPASGAACP